MTLQVSCQLFKTTKSCFAFVRNIRQSCRSLQTQTETHTHVLSMVFSVLRHPLEFIFISPGPQQEQAWTGTSRENLFNTQIRQKNSTKVMKNPYCRCCLICFAREPVVQRLSSKRHCVCDSMVFDTVHFDVAVFSCIQS